MGLYFFLVAGIDIFWVNTLPLVVETPFCFVAQVGLNSQSSCFSLFNAGIMGMYHHADFMKKKNFWLFQKTEFSLLKSIFPCGGVAFTNHFSEICTLNESLKKTPKFGCLCCPVLGDRDTPIHSVLSWDSHLMSLLTLFVFHYWQFN